MYEKNERMVEWDCWRGLINYYVVLFCFHVLWFFSSHFNVICLELSQCATSYFMLYRHWSDDKKKLLFPKSNCNFFICSCFSLLFLLKNSFLSTHFVPTADASALSIRRKDSLFSFHSWKNKEEKYRNFCYILFNIVRFIRNFLYLPFMSRLW